MNKNSPLISAIVITYNGMRFLPDCMRTLSDDLKNLSHEIIVVDNGSLDGSIEFIRKNYPNTNLHANETNLGFAQAVNIGIKASHGQYVYILNQDLRFRNGTAVKLLERLKQDETIGLIGPGYVDFDGKPHRSAKNIPSYRHVIYHAFFLDRIFYKHRELNSWNIGDFDHNVERFVGQPMGAVMLLPRTVIDIVGLMDERFPILFNDVDYCHRIDEAGYKCLYYPDATVEHYIGGSTSRQPIKHRWISHMSFYRYLRKYAQPIEWPLLWLSGLLLTIGIVPVIVIDLIRGNKRT